MCAKLRQPQHAQRWSLQGGIAMMKMDVKGHADDVDDDDDDDNEMGEEERKLCGREKYGNKED